MTEHPPVSANTALLHRARRFAQPGNIIRWDDVPDDAPQPEFAYRSQAWKEQDTPALARSKLLRRLLWSAFLAFVLIALGTVPPFIPAVLALFPALYYFVPAFREFTETLRSFGFGAVVFLAGVAALGWTHEISPSRQTGIILSHLAATGGLLLLADVVAGHYWRWLCASPRLAPTQVRSHLEAQWKRRWRRGLPEGDQLSRARGAFLRCYRRRIALCAFGYFAVLPICAHLDPSNIVWPLVLGAGLVLFLRHQALLATLGDCLVRYTLYGVAFTRDGEQELPPAPGLFLGALGSYRARGLLFVAVSVLVLSSTSTFTSYLQVGHRTHPFKEYSAQALVESGAEEVSLAPIGAKLQGTYIPATITESFHEAWLAEIPLGHLAISWDAMFRLSFWPIPLVIGSSTLAVFLPLLALSWMLVAALPSLHALRSQLETPGSSLRAREESETWELLNQRLREAPSSFERDHIWLGAEPEFDLPILLHRSVLEEHGYILGSSGSGKTARGMIPLATELIRRNDTAVIIIDPKGDRPFLHTARIEADGVTRADGSGAFRWFTHEAEKPTYIFNPFQNLYDASVSINQLLDTVLDALDLFYGKGYGRGYFAARIRSAFRTVASRFDIEDFRHLRELVDHPENRGSIDKEDAFEFIAVVEQLADVPQLTYLSRDRQADDPRVDAAISMREVLEKNQTLYFWLPATSGKQTAGEIARLALHSLWITAAKLQDEGKQTRAVVFIDEFQEVVASNFQEVLAMARSAGISVILANQTPASIRVSDAPELPEVIKQNTRFKEYFAFTDERTPAEVAEASGEVLEYYVTMTPFESKPRYGFRFNNAITINDLNRMSNDPDLALVSIGRGAGYSQFGGMPFEMRTCFSMDQQEYVRRSRMPWPEATSETFTASRRPESTVQELLVPAAEFRRLRIVPPPELEGDPGPTPVSDPAWRRRLVEVYNKRTGADLALPPEVTV